jgi:hypothetical protein
MWTMWWKIVNESSLVFSAPLLMLPVHKWLHRIHISAKGAFAKPSLFILFQVSCAQDFNGAPEKVTDFDRLFPLVYT